MPKTPYHRDKHYIGGSRNQDVYESIKKGQIRLVKGELERYTEKGMRISGQEEEADVIIFATGFQRSLLGIGDDWRYRNVISPGLKNCAVIGIVNTYCNTLQTNLQAVWLAEVLRGKIKLPSLSEMKKDIEDRKAYSLSVIPYPSWASFSWLPYPINDQLLEDMGLPTNRKKNRFAYWTEPIKPEDYRLVVTHRV